MFLSVVRDHSEELPLKVLIKEIDAYSLKHSTIISVNFAEMLDYRDINTTASVVKRMRKRQKRVTNINTNMYIQQTSSRFYLSSTLMKLWSALGYSRTHFSYNAAALTKTIFDYCALLKKIIVGLLRCQQRKFGRTIISVCL